MFVQHLRRRQVEILLRHVHPAFAEGVHARLGADALELRARTTVHLLGDLGQVDAAREVHAAAVDAEDIGAGFDSKGGKLDMCYVVEFGRGRAYVGGGNSIFRSIRPGRRRAGSRMSSLFVAMMTLMFFVGSKPSS